MSDWAGDYFEKGYAQRWGLPPLSAAVRREVDGICRLLQVDDRTTCVADIACGHGRHALAFAERGHYVIGVDFAVALLKRAQELSAESGVRACWVRADMRQLPLKSACAESVIVTDSLWLFDADEENEAVLHEAARILAPNGALALKVVNGAPILAAFRETDRQERDGVVVAISRTLVDKPVRMTERIRVSGRRGSGDYVREQRHQIDDLRDALARARLSTVSVFSSPEGAPFHSAHSATMWIIARRSAA
jgi:ubiquinone/menaquinone biosynthesis C-methylase UbiE